MTTPNEAAEAVYSRFATEFGGASPVPFVFEDEDFKAPRGSWMRLWINTNSRNQDTLGPKGARRYFSGASILVECYTLTNQGRKAADDLARRVVTLFEGETFSGVTGNDGIAREQPVSGRWYKIVCEVAFTYDETK